jgi:hypothetical protein
MKQLKTLALAATLALTSGVAMAQSVGNGNPARANTTDPNSSPRMGAQGTRPAAPGVDAAGRANTADPNSAPGMGSQGTRTTGQGLDAAGRANTSDPNSARSGGTGASGQPVDPTANPRQR